MNKKLLLILLLPLIYFSFTAYKPGDKLGDKPVNNGNNGNIGYRINPGNNNNPLAVSSLQLNANQINTWFRTNGSFNRDPTTGNAGFEWPKGSSKFARYASGLWLGCTVGTDTLTAIAEYAYDYLPGFIDNNGNPQGKDDPLYRIYSINQGNTTSEDYLNWPVSQGAYVDSLGKPLFLGTQTMFYVYTDGYPHSQGATSLRSLKAQVLQTNWSYNVNGPLGNIAFTEYRVINRSSDTWNNTYLSNWTDDDLGGSADDAIGVDTTRNLGYTYNNTNNDPSYGSSPPAVGFDFFRGPITQTGNNNDTVKFYSPPGSNNLLTKVGYKELGLTVFNTYNNGSPQPSDPRTNTEVYRVITGYWRTGESWTNPVNSTVTKKVYSGDPVTGTGWVMSGGNDRRFIQSSGPFTMAPGDTQYIVVAQVIARGGSNLQSITSLRSTDDLAQRIFDNNFQVPPSAPQVNVNAYAPGNGKVYLSWNDSVENIVIPNKLSFGTYRFEGYNIYQIKTGTNGTNPEDRILLATFDKINGVTDIKDSIFVEQYGTFIYYTVQKGSDNGISRFIVLNKDAINNLPFYNGTEYLFAVTSYFYDPQGGPFSAPKVNETPITAANILHVVPQGVTLGTQISYKTGDTISTGNKDAAVVPTVVAPLSLKTATYTVTFFQTATDTLYRITRVLNGQTTVVVDNADFGAKLVDGVLITVQPTNDSGVVKDFNDPSFGESTNRSTLGMGWSYNPPANQWVKGPDPVADSLRGRTFNKGLQSRSMGLTFPTTTNFRGNFTRIKANGTYIQSGTGTNTLPTGGPLRKMKIIFGQNSMAYRYVAKDATGNPRNVLETDSTFTNTPYQDMVQIPFSAYLIDELDSTDGAPRQVNIAFVDADADGAWNPDTTKLGKFQITYFFTTSYSTTPDPQYTSKNPGLGSPATGFPALDIMYAWFPRAINKNGAQLTFSNNDEMIVYPYRPIRGDFVPGYPVEYSFSINGTNIGNVSSASQQLDKIKVFPNPYYGQSRLERDAFDRFVTFTNLPAVATIYIYTLDGLLVKKIDRNNSNPNNSMERWDLKNMSDIDVASGMYIAYIDCKAIGNKVLKLAIFTPQERIQTF
jgi:hypothetical protein